MSKIRRGARALVASAIALGGLAVTASPASATHVVCGQLVTSSITLDSNLGPCPGDGLIVVADNVTIDLNGFTISAANGAGDNAGISIGRLAAPPAGPGGTPVAPLAVSGVTVKNGTVQGFDAGVVIAGIVTRCSPEPGTPGAPTVPCPAGTPEGTIMSEEGGGNTVRNLTIQNNVNDQLGPPCNLGEGVAIFNSDDNRIIDNRVLNNGPYGGISVVEDSDRNLISGNVVLGHNLRSRGGSGCGNQNQSSGIRIEGPGAVGNIVENNRVEGSGLAGIALHGYVCNPGPNEDATDPNTGTIVRRNTVVNNEQDGIAFLEQGPATIVCPAFGNTVERNISSNNGILAGSGGMTGYGILVAYNSYDNVISHNVTNNNADDGIRLDDAVLTNTFTNVGPTVVDLVSPDRLPYVEGTDYRVMSGSGSGNVTARLRAIDISVGGSGTTNTNPVDSSTSGCEQADYTAAGFQAGDIALIQRGTCSFVDKVRLAIANGASAVIMLNEGQSGRTTSAFGSVGPVTIPVISTTFAVGRELYNLTQAGAVTIRVQTTTTNVETVAAPAAYDNTLIANRGSGNGGVDGYDGNLEPPCDNNKWRASRFGTVNQPCVLGPGGSGTAKGRSGERPGNPDQGMDAGEARGRSAGARI